MSFFGVVLYIVYDVDVGYMTQKTDNELMKRVVERDTQALKILYKRYEMQMYNFLIRYTGNRAIAQELLQETFTRVWLAARSFNVKRGKFKGWLYTIALNLSRNEMSKKEYTFRFLDAQEFRGGALPGEMKDFKNPESLHGQKEQEHAAARAVGMLPPRLREVVVMKHYKGLTFREISEVAGLPESTS